MKVAIQGELGSFSHEAALQLSPGATIVPLATSRDVYDAVLAGKVQKAAVPIENSLAGTVAENLDLLLSSQLFITREFRMRIEHNLIAAPGARLRDLRRVLSHPVALAQCREVFRKHRTLRPEPFYDTAGSVKHVMENGLRDAAGIASVSAARQYGAEILLRGIEDNKQNYTRFFLIQKRRAIADDANKTSIAFSLRNVPGALFKALSVFTLRDINLSKIESRPIPGRPWEYMFFVDMLRGEDGVSKRALEHLREFAASVAVLGVYPAAPEIKPTAEKKPRKSKSPR